MIDFTPDPVFLRILGIPIYWYGIAYAVGLAVVYWVLIREARFRGLDETLVGTGMIVVAVAALIGGRLYHVIDQWQLYEAHPITAILPIAIQPDGSYAFAGFTGLGVPGGIVTGTIAGYLFVRWKRQSFPMWADVVAPGLFVMQAIGRWGNFFNQELYGPPTDLPWGIKTDCVHRIVDYPCSVYPEATTHFQPLFLYESISGIIGALVLIYLGRRWSHKLISGDLLPEHGHRSTAQDDEAAFWEDETDGDLAAGADEEAGGDGDDADEETEGDGVVDVDEDDAGEETGADAGEDDAGEETGVDADEDDAGEPDPPPG